MKTNEKKKNGHLKKSVKTSLSLESYQIELMALKRINASGLARDLIDNFLKENFPSDYKKFKASQEL